MKRAFVLGGIFFLVAISLSAAVPGHVSVNGTQFEVCGKRIWMNGCNTPWDNWNDFGGSFDGNFWNTHYNNINTNYGVNSSRVWITCSGEVGIDIDSSGYVSGGTADHWADLETFFDYAEDNGIYIMATLISFDHFKTDYTTYLRWRNWINDDENIDSYIDNYLMEFLTRFGNRDVLWSIDLCNEPDWSTDTEGGTIPWSRHQTYWAKAAKAIHENSSTLVTVGMGVIKYNSDASGMNGNMASDSALQAITGDTDSYMDFWSPHYYPWQEEWFGIPFYQTPGDYGLTTDRPAVVGECPSPGSTGHTITEDYENAYLNGWQGVMPWTSNGVDDIGDITDMGPGTQAFRDNHYDLVFPQCETPTYTPTISAQGNDAVISWDDMQQEISGFGASSAWSEWGGNSADNTWLVNHASEFFGTGAGEIGLSIIRARIPPDTSQWASTAAPLQAARDLGITRIIASAWTPPAKWKSNGAVDNENGAYLLPEYYDEYANYLRDYIIEMRDNQNVDIYGISPANEPDYQVSYDGCSWTGEELRDFVKNNLGPTLDVAGLDTKIIIGESFNNNLNITDPTLNDSASRGYCDIVAAHTYGGGPTAYPLAQTYNKEYWMTERSNFDAYDATMAGTPGMGLVTAKWIHNHLVNAEYNAFIYWWLASDQNNEGLRSETLGIPKRFWVMGNYSKFIRPGFNRIGATANPNTNVYVSAYKNTGTNDLVIVAINEGGSDVNQGFEISGTTLGSVTPWITSPTYDLQEMAVVNVNGTSFTYILPANSVVSFVAGGGATPTYTPYAGTATFTATATPTPSSVLLDDMEDGDNVNNWSGDWYMYQDTSSTITPDPFAMTAGGMPGSENYRAEISGNVSSYAGMGTNLNADGTAVDLSSYSAVEFYVKGDGGSYWFQFTQPSITDDDYFGVTFTAPSGWTKVTVPLDEASLSQRGFGEPAAFTKNEIIALQWSSNGTGALEIQVDDISFLLEGGVDTPTYTATSSQVPTNSFTPTITTTGSQVPTDSFTPTFTPTITETETPEDTPTETFTHTSTDTRQETSTFTPTVSFTPTYTLTNSPSATATNSKQPTMIFTQTATGTRQPTSSYTFTQTATSTMQPTMSYTPTITMTGTGTPTFTSSVSATETGTATNTNTPVLSPTPTFTGSPPTLTFTSTITHTGTATATGTFTPTFTPTYTGTRTGTPSFTPTGTGSFTQTVTITDTETQGPTATYTDTPQDTETFTPAITETEDIISPTFTETEQEDTPTFTVTLTDTETVTITNTYTSSPTITQTPTGTPPTRTFTPTITETETSEDTPTETFTHTSTDTRQETSTFTPTITTTSSQVATESYTPTFTTTSSQVPTDSYTPTRIPTVPFTFTATSTLSPTFTYTVTSTPTLTGSMTLTMTATLTATGTEQATMTFTSTPYDTATPEPTQTNKIKIATQTPVIVYPNPNPKIKEEGVTLKFEITKDAEIMKIKIYTTAMRLVREMEYNAVQVPGGLQHGIVEVPLEPGLFRGLARGVYYYVVFVEDIDGNPAWSKIGKLIIPK